MIFNNYIDDNFFNKLLDNLAIFNYKINKLFNSKNDILVVCTELY